MISIIKNLKIILILFFISLKSLANDVIPVDIIADEMQNSTPNQMKLLLTRLGEGTKIVVTGDLEQSDLEGDNGLENLVYKMQCTELDYIQHVEMGDDDIVRHPAVKEVLGILSK